jgi:hypothetical protein
MACAGLVVFEVHRVTKDKTGWWRWLPMTGARWARALSRRATGVGAIALAAIEGGKKLYEMAEEWDDIIDRITAKTGVMGCRGRRAHAHSRSSSSSSHSQPPPSQ